MRDGRAHLLVLLDGAPDDRVTADYGRRVAVAFDAAITLLHVVRIPEEFLALVPTSAVVADLAAEPHATGAPELRVVVSSSPARALLEAAGDGGFDLIVVGLGAERSGVVAHVLARATIPVLTVPH